MKRRDFIKTSGSALVVGAASTLAAPSVLAQSKKTYELKMVSTWPPGFAPLQPAAERLAKNIEKASGGRIKIKTYAGGELIPPLESFDAVSQGAADIAHCAAFYWAGKVPASQWFSAAPFGMNRDIINAWIYTGDGLKLYEEIYAPHNLVPRIAGSTGIQAAGWFNKKINSVDDLKGLKIRIPGLGGKVYAKLGASVVLLPGSEIFTSLEKGVVDAVEWTGPVMDERFGFNKVAKYCYNPGWHEPGTPLEVIFNKNVYDSFDDELKMIVDNACAMEEHIVAGEFLRDNGPAMVRMQKSGSEFLNFPDDVLAAFRKASKEAIAEITASDPLAAKVNNNYQDFLNSVKPWLEVSEKEYYTRIL